MKKKHVRFIFPDTPLRSVKYLSDTPKSMQRRGHINIMKPAPATKQGVVILSSLTAASRRPTSWSMMIPFLIKRRGKLDKKRNSESAKAHLEDFGDTYGIDYLKICEAKHDLDDSD